MGVPVRGLLKYKWQQQLQFVRYKTKVNVTKPRPPHFERALVEQVCAPYFVTKRRPQHIPFPESCAVINNNKPVVENNHPLMQILTQESINLFQNSRLIAFFHLNSLSSEEKFQYKLLMNKNNMKLLFLNKEVLKKAFSGTMYETVLSLYNAPTVTGFSPEPDMHRLLNLLKKVPKLCLMGAIVENKFLSVSDFKTYGMFKDMVQVRSNLVSVLHSVLQNLVQQMSHHPSNFVEQLNQQKELLKEKNKS